jgi:hypothetical protein
MLLRLVFSTWAFFSEVKDVCHSFRFICDDDDDVNNMIYY